MKVSILSCRVHSSFKMAVWWQALILLCCVLNCVTSFNPSPLFLKNKYNNSFRLTRSTRTRVQQLYDEYKEQQLGNKHFEDRSLHLKGLPLLSTDFYSWLKLTDWERLHAALVDMQSYWNMLEWKRTQLEEEEKEKKRGQPENNTLSEKIKYIQLDLRDLMSQVSSQMSYIQGSWTRPSPPTVQIPLKPETSSKTVWESRVEGYVILRDLDLYLTKLAREFLLLASRVYMLQE